MPSRISVETLCKLLRYEPETGKLFWLKRTSDMFAEGNIGSVANCARWNRKFSGKEAFTSIDGGGYKHGNIFDKTYYAHRIIWAMVTGEWPVDQIDHEDHDKLNNKFVNLFEATNQENSKNQPMQPHNTSGFNGVIWYKPTGKWRANIKVDGKSKYLGYFKNKSDAIAARQAANIKYGFHKNHGV